MTQTELNANTKLIADFMGYRYVPFNDPQFREHPRFKPGYWKIELPPLFQHKISESFNHYLGRSIHDLHFHSDWNKLMRVYHRLVKYADILVEKLSDAEETNDFYYSYTITYNKLARGKSIVEVFEAVCDCIKTIKPEWHPFIIANRLTWLC